jgi:hypothetical protein
MRVMVIVKATAETEAGVLPSEQLLTEMGKFNEELVKAGVLLEPPVARARRGLRAGLAGYSSAPIGIPGGASMGSAGANFAGSLR